MTFSTIPRITARPKRKRNPWIHGGAGMGPVPREKRAPAEPDKRIYPCAYCRKAPGVTQDHVVPKSFYRGKRDTVPLELLRTVPCCRECNWRKATRRLIPRHWRHLLPLLTETFPGTPWRIWSGGAEEEAYRATHKEMIGAYRGVAS